jgi:hypothetical protein
LILVPFVDETAIDATSKAQMVRTEADETDFTRERAEKAS